MKSFLIIGMGTFGHHLCQALSRVKCEIMVADKNPDSLNDVLDLVVGAKICDCTNLDVLKSFDVKNYDACFVCLNSSFQAGLEITDQLNELGAKKIYSKADRDLEAKFLRRAGADHIIYPERETAERIAISASSDQIFDFIGLDEDCSICEISPRPEWVGKSLSQLALRTKYGLNLIAARKGGRVVPVLDPSYVFRDEEHVFVIGDIDDVRKVT